MTFLACHGKWQKPPDKQQNKSIHATVFLLPAVFKEESVRNIDFDMGALW